MANQGNFPAEDSSREIGSAHFPSRRSSRNSIRKAEKPGLEVSAPDLPSSASGPNLGTAGSQPAGSTAQPVAAIGDTTQPPAQTAVQQQPFPWQRPSRTEPTPAPQAVPPASQSTPSAQTIAAATQPAPNQSTPSNQTANAPAPISPATPPANRRPAVTLTNVYKIYGQGETQVNALDNVSAQIYLGEFTAIVGPSGSGKSTLLHCLAGLDSVTSGTIEVGGQNLHQMNDKALTKFRRERIGFIFQAFNLVPTLSAKENITLPLRLAGKRVDQKRLEQVVKSLGLEKRLHHKPSQLSGGQQQRVAVARALFSKPALLVADEPTGNLDSHASNDVLALLKETVQKLGQTVVMVTHDHRAAAMADRVLVIKDGQIAQDIYRPTEQQIAQAI